MVKVSLYICMSLDGYIAKENGSVDWLESYNTPQVDYGYKEFYESIDCLIFGNKTYTQVKTFGKFPYPDKKCFVYSKSKIGKDGNVTFVKEEPEELLKKIKNQKLNHIWLMGGAEIVNLFLEKDLIDSYQIFIMPIILGEGISLFKKGKMKNLKFDYVKNYPTGVVEAGYLND